MSRRLLTVTLVALAPLAGYLCWRITGNPSMGITLVVINVFSPLVNRSERMRWRLIAYLLVTIGMPLAELGLQALGWSHIAPPGGR